MEDRQLAALKTVWIFYDRSEAIVAMSMLDAHGLYVAMPDWFHTANAWHLTVALHGIRLHVLDDHEHDAVELLKGVPDYRTPPTKISVGNGVIALLCWTIAALPYPVRRRGDTDRGD